MAALDAHVPPGMSRFEAFFRRPPFDGTGHVDQMLTEAGYQAVQTVIHQVDTVYDSPGQWWAACRSQAPWAIAWRHIPPGRLEAARRDAFTVLDGLAGPGGTLTRTLTFACTTGRKAGSSAATEGDAVSKSALPIRSALEMLRLECPEYRIDQRVIG